MMARRVAILTLVQSPDLKKRVIHSFTKCAPSQNKEIEAYHIIACCRNQQTPEKKDAITRRLSPLDPALCASLIPRPPHIGLRIHDRPRRQKLLHHRRMPVPRSSVQRCESILRRAAGLSQTHPLSARVRRKTTTPRQARFGLADFRCNDRSLGGLHAILQNNQYKEKGACTSRAPSHTRNPLHHTRIWAQKRTENDTVPFLQNQLWPKELHFDADAVS